MFDEILNLVKQHLGNNPQIADSLPPDQADQVHQEVASHINDKLKDHAVEQGGVGGLLSSLQNAATSGSPLTGAIEGGLVGSLASKFGLSPAVTGAITGALPGILQKFAHKANDPNDHSITPQSIGSSIGDLF